MGFFKSDREKAGPGVPVELSEKMFDEFIAANPRVVVEVYSPGCSHCRSMEPIFLALAKEMEKDARFGMLNAPANLTIAYRYDVEATPTFLIFGQGRLMATLVGELTKDALRIELEKSVSKSISQTQGP
jgi:thioredoxin 1